MFMFHWGYLGLYFTKGMCEIILLLRTVMSGHIDIYGRYVFDEYTFPVMCVYGLYYPSLVSNGAILITPF